MTGAGFIADAAGGGTGRLGDPAGDPVGDPVGDPGWAEASLAATLFAIDPVGTGGVVLRALPGPVRDLWLGQLRTLLPPGEPLRRVPLHVSDGRLLGGLDLAATLESGRPVVERGILAEADGGVVVLAMAERLLPSSAGRWVHVLDAGEVALERDGLTRRFATRFGVVALDEGIEAGERPPAALTDRLAFHLDLARLSMQQAQLELPDVEGCRAGREILPGVAIGEEFVEALCACALALGIDSLRAPLLAVRAARAAAAAAGRSEVGAEDTAAAARLVLAPRARSLPAGEPEPETPGDEARSQDSGQQGEPTADESGQGQRDEAPDEAPPDDDGGSLSEWVLKAATSSVPTGLLEQLRLCGVGGSRQSAPGRSGVRQHSQRRGRPCGVRRGAPRGGARLNVVETLRAAAPWQPIRRRESQERAPQGRPVRAVRVEVRPDDFHVSRFRQRSETTVIFAVDASGSSALHRLSEAKGAVELLLAECYVRRDRVALVSFRGHDAEILLSPTRSLVRAKRGLAGLPGGGGTPLAAGIETASRLARAVLREGGTPLLVFLTDGHANVSRDGSPGRAQAEQEATAAARACGAETAGALLIDTSPRPQAQARELAREMGASYLPLPHADSARLCQTVRDAARRTPAASPGVAGR